MQHLRQLLYARTTAASEAHAKAASETRLGDSGTGVARSLLIAKANPGGKIGRYYHSDVIDPTLPNML